MIQTQMAISPPSKYQRHQVLNVRQTIRSWHSHFASFFQGEHECFWTEIKDRFFYYVLSNRLEFSHSELKTVELETRSLMRSIPLVDGKISMGYLRCHDNKCSTRPLVDDQIFWTSREDWFDVTAACGRAPVHCFNYIHSHRLFNFSSFGFINCLIPFRTPSWLVDRQLFHAAFWNLS